MRLPIAAFSRPSRLRSSAGRQNPRGLSQSRLKTLKKLATRPQRCKFSPNEHDAKAILPEPRSVKKAIGYQGRCYKLPGSLSATPHMKQQLPKLLKRLRAATQLYGSQAKLAAAIGAPRPQIGRWRRGLTAPGGENMLRLLAWLEQQPDGKQKARRR